MESRGFREFMKFEKTLLPGVFVITLHPHFDERGAFTRIFCKNEFKTINHSKDFVQMNHSLTYKKGTVRGLHYQKFPYCETKLIRCIQGSVFDVIVDLRKDSPTRLKWIGVELSRVNLKMVYIPEGCAHGFQTLEDNSEMFYQHTQFYSPGYEGSINYNDKTINISWPLEISSISDKDKNSLLIDEKFGVEEN
jgi:dTDP-4-dehydrorhamnose 3,5-epimerase